MSDTDYDVIVVGSGAAGLAAAVAAADAGATVLVVEADTRVGGSSRLSGGHVYAAGTRLQQQAGIDDSADAMFEHYMTLNQWLVEPAVVRRYCDASAATFDWLCELGVSFPVAGLYRSGAGSTPRGHRPDGAGERVIEVLDAQRARRGVDLVLDARVDELLRDAGGRIGGVRIGTDRATAGAVVLACGGFGANPDMLARHYPRAAAAGDWSWYIGSPFARGDGITLACAQGAALDGHDRGLLLATPGFSRDLEVLLPGWLILVNQAGRRFADETAPYTVLGGLIDHQAGPVYAVFDEGARAVARPSPLSRAYWVADVLEARADDGTIVRADTVTALAAATGIRADALAGTLATYNADCTAGFDSRFFKSASSGMRPIVQPPFYAARIQPAIVCWTGAGVRIDADTRVLDEAERPIAGLYAAGETVGSLHGDRYIGGGGSFGPAIMFGRLAGEHAALASRGN